ncbi:MAG: radical SAM protein [Methanobacteriota archaeon]|nr:MAG: radical SAM protein [Euryarchaeota archaeon]
MVKFVEIEAKSMLTKHRFRDNWFWNRYSINPYRGCQFACNYCDAITERYLVHEDYRDFSRVIYVKKDAPGVLERELKKAIPDVVAMSGVTDPYQPAEKRYEVTRGVLEILARHRFPVHIITKSDLVLRDIDLLGEIAKQAWCTVSMTIVTFSRRLLSLLEPFAPSPEKRLDAVRILNEEGIQAGVDFTPIVPYLLDSEENMEEVIKRASECARYVLIGGAMTLRSNQRLRFMELLERNLPGLVEKYEKLYGKQESPSQDYVVKVNKKAFQFCRGYGIENYIPPPSFERALSQKTLTPKEGFDKENFEVASHLLLMAFFKEFKSGDPYSAWAYHRASQSIENLNESIKEIYKRGELRKIPGVGESISREIEEFLAKGRSERLEKEMSTW